MGKPEEPRRSAISFRPLALPCHDAIPAEGTRHAERDLTVRFYEYGPAPGISFHDISHDDVHVECGLDSICRWIGRHRLMHFDGDFEGAMDAELTIRARIEELALDLTEMGVPLERSLAWLEVFRRKESARMLIEFEAAEEGDDMAVYVEISKPLLW